jgi:hypothetical protein
MLKENKNYVFIINNVFHIIYYISLINKFNIKKYLLIINNTNNFFYLWKYNKVFNENNIKYFVCCWENYNFKNFLYKIPFNYIYCYINLYKYRKYNLIISDDNNISNQIIINSVWIRNKELILINNNLYWLIYKKYKFENKFKVNKIYNLFLKFCKINKRREIWKNYLYNKKYYIDAIDLSLIKDSKEYLENIFKSYIKWLDKIINNNNNIILFSQNLIDEWRINKSDYLRNLEKIQRKFQWYNLYIKPHPLENTTYYENEYKVINKFIPSELLDIYLSMFWKNIYLTYYSTIILNIQNWDKFLIDFNNLPNEEKLIIKELNTNFNIDILKINE